MDKCLLCDEDIDKGRSVWEMLNDNDQLCGKCRKQLIENRQHIKLMGINVKSSYLYNDFFSKLIIQYKECYDEALKNVFLSYVKKDVYKYLRGYTLLLMPSSLSKVEERGFNHLELMFESLGIKMLDCFEKTSEIDQKKQKGSMRANMRHDIVLKEGIKLPKKIALVDDILTTGNTLMGALNCLDLKAHKIKIYTVAIHQKPHKHGSVAQLIKR